MHISLKVLVGFGAIVATTFLGSACEENQPVCIPKKTIECFCETGERGTQTCTDDGYEYYSCVCNPDAGVTADASIDAE